MLICQLNSDHAKSIYSLVLMDDNAYQDIGVSNRSPSGEFLPNERYLMMSLDAGVGNVNYLEGLAQNAKRLGVLLPIPKEDLPCIGGLVFVPTRDLTYSVAMKEIKAYIETVGNRRVYISELAEELQIDMDLIESILNDILRASGIDGYV